MQDHGPAPFERLHRRLDEPGGEAPQRQFRGLSSGPDGGVEGPLGAGLQHHAPCADPQGGQGGLADAALVAQAPLAPGVVGGGELAQVQRRHPAGRLVLAGPSGLLHPGDGVAQVGAVMGELVPHHQATPEHAQQPRPEGTEPVRGPVGVAHHGQPLVEDPQVAQQEAAAHLRVAGDSHVDGEVGAVPVRPAGLGRQGVDRLREAPRIGSQRAQVRTAVAGEVPRELQRPQIRLDQAAQPMPLRHPLDPLPHVPRDLAQPVGVPQGVAPHQRHDGEQPVHQGGRLAPVHVA